jgi:hypothetical protein
MNCSKYPSSSPWPSLFLTLLGGEFPLGVFLLGLFSIASAGRNGVVEGKKGGCFFVACVFVFFFWQCWTGQGRTGRWEMALHLFFLSNTLQSPTTPMGVVPFFLVSGSFRRGRRRIAYEVFVMMMLLSLLTLLAGRNCGRDLSALSVDSVGFSSSLFGCLTFFVSSFPSFPLHSIVLFCFST